jgi:hypothetical protein
MPLINVRATFRLSTTHFDLDPEDIFDEELEFDPTFNFELEGKEIELYEDNNEAIEVNEESDEVVFFSFFSFDFNLKSPRGSSLAKIELDELVNSVGSGSATLTISEQTFRSEKIELCHTSLTMDSYEVGEDFQEILDQYRTFVESNGLYPEDRLKLAQDVLTDTKTLAMLAMDKNFDIRMAVAKHPKTSAETLEMIADDLDREDWFPEEYINQECPDWYLKLGPEYNYDDFGQWLYYVQDLNEEIKNAISER